MTASSRRFTQDFKDELCREVIDTSEPINPLEAHANERSRMRWSTRLGIRRQVPLRSSSFFSGLTSRQPSVL